MSPFTLSVPLLSELTDKEREVAMARYQVVGISLVLQQTSIIG
jgi:hypothetical protein